MSVRHWLNRVRRRLFPREQEQPSGVDQAALRQKAAATQTASFYGQSYFDAPKDVGCASGYAGYTAHDPTIEAAARIVTTFFQPRRVLDVGCAKGYVVARLRALGIDAWGMDLSSYAVQSAPDAARDFCLVGDVLDIRFPSSSFDLLVCIETLEHLPPEQAMRAVAELYRVTSGQVWVTTPAMGINDFGPPNGWPQGKVREECLSRYLDPAGFPEPALLEDLMLDKNGYPQHGHLTIGSYRWWTELFTRQGFVRCGEIEKQINAHESLVRDGLWNSLVFEKPQPGTADQLREAQQAAIERLPHDACRSEVGQAGVCSWDPEHMAFVCPGNRASGLLLSWPHLALPPGRYQVQMQLGIAGDEPPAGEWAEAALLEVRSAERQRIHALRTVRHRDVGAARHATFELPFACCGELDLELGVWTSGHGRVEIKVPPVVRSSQDGQTA